LLFKFVCKLVIIFTLAENRFGDFSRWIRKNCIECCIPLNWLGLAAPRH
jgi:hypothetical protein